MNKGEKTKLLFSIQSDVYFGKLTKKEIDKAVEKGLSDREEDNMEELKINNLI